MINQSDSIEYDVLGFDGEKYIDLQRRQILDRVSKFPGRLYLEIGWKFLFDWHASRVLPWFFPDSKVRIFSELAKQAELLFCVNAQDLEKNRQLSNKEISYQEYVFGLLLSFEEKLNLKAKVVVNMIKKWEKYSKLKLFVKELKKLWYSVYKRYFIEWYPSTDIVLSPTGYGDDDYIPLKKNLVLVNGAASNSGKMSTCLGQIYLDEKHGVKSGYAKYETFPIWNFSVDHPVNLAYEAATADIGDYNCIDSYHEKAYGQKTTNYNRDVEWFEIVMSIAKNVVNHKNYMRKYKSPTDMWISTAGFAIMDDEVISRASLEEINRRKARYQQMIDRWEWKKIWIDRCDEIEKKCLAYFERKGYA